MPMGHVETGHRRDEFKKIRELLIVFGGRAQQQV